MARIPQRLRHLIAINSTLHERRSPISGNRDLVQLSQVDLNAVAESAQCLRRAVGAIHRKEWKTVGIGVSDLRKAGQSVGRMI